MPLTLEELEEIQAECLADDIAIDFEWMKLWDAEGARNYFESGGQDWPKPSEPASAMRAEPAAPPLPRVPDELFKKWFPKWTGASAAPRFRLVCFHSAGSAENIYSGRGMRMKAESPFVLHCKDKGGELLACELPGREGRRAEPRFTQLRSAAEALFGVLAPLLQSQPEVPYVLVGHSMGSWLLFELLKLLLARKIPPPQQLVISSFPAPSLPAAQRPWRSQRSLDKEAFKEECRGWDTNEVLFQESVWAQYEPLMRDDFTLFDEYEYVPASARFAVPIQAFVAERDQRVSEAHVRGWAEVTSEDFSLERVAGHHLFFYDYPVRNAWMDTVLAALPKSCR